MEHGKQVIWVNDNQGCIGRMNSILDPRAVCDGDTVAGKIRECLVSKNCTIVARWIPRELNTLADHLSHLAFDASEDEVRGEELGREGGKFPVVLFFCPQEMFGKRLPSYMNHKVRKQKEPKVKFKKAKIPIVPAIARLFQCSCGFELMNVFALQKHCIATGHKMLMPNPVESWTRDVNLPPQRGSLKAATVAANFRFIPVAVLRRRY
jgi:hypothetical protein